MRRHTKFNGVALLFIPLLWLKWKTGFGVFIRSDPCNTRSPLMKTLDWSAETLGSECNSIWPCIHLKMTRVATKHVKIFKL